MLTVEHFEIGGDILSFQQDEATIGRCRVVPSYYIAGALELWEFGIVGKYRGLGFGQQFLKEVIAYYPKQTIVLFVLKENKRALHIYHKLGFKITGLYRGGDYAWEMRLEQ